ncbi:tyrosine-type recombinase/integrase [Singulisphaera sp. PoT]|uniref:tyrosine-type recombinase/integrase n=1 Tax=Singulisphaera sp. PoT TaxID=3411797 RepID=UPI003BF5A0FA
MLPGPHRPNGALAVPLPIVELRVPALIADAGDRAARRFLEFFTATIRNPNTRGAYSRACRDFFAWCQQHHLALADIEPLHVATYIEALTARRSAPTVKQHLAAIKMLFDHLVTGQVVAFNPASSVRGPKHVVKKGKTPVLTADDARALLDSIVPDEGNARLIDLRDRALIAVMVYSFARISAVVGMKVEDYYPNGKRWWLRLHEKGGKFHEMPAHHNAEAYLDAYIQAAGISEERKSPLFRSIPARTGNMTALPLDRRNAWDMVKRRAKAAGLTNRLCNHSFRGTGITAYLENGGDIVKAQQMAAHADIKTTKLYDRTDDQVTLDEVERIGI